MTSQPFSEDPTAPVQAIFDAFRRRVDEGHTPASSFVLFSAEGIELEGGFGQHRLGGSAPQGGTAFRIASCTKSFTCATLLLLRDRGLLDLDSPITEFVPEYRPTTPPSDPVTPTVRMLMTMSGGLPTDDPWGDRQESMTRAELGALLRAGVPTVSIPGTSFEYSNLGYALLGQVIASVTQRPYIDVVREELLQPLGLDSTRFRAQDSSSELALGYRRSGDRWVGLPFSDPGVFSPMGGLFSTPYDLARWAAWLASAFSPVGALDGPLSPASRREMQQIHRSIAADPEAPATSPGEQGYGFGLFVERDPIWGTQAYHSGGYPGFSTHMRWNNDAQIGVVGFENATYSGAKVPVAEALELAVRHLGRRVVGSTPWPETLALREAAVSLVLAWDDGIADRIFADNVAPDIPYDERVATIASAIERVGGLEPGLAGDASEAQGDSPAHLVWHIPGRSGRLRCEIRLAPTTPAAIQTFIVTAV